MGVNRRQAIKAGITATVAMLDTYGSSLAHANARGKKIAVKSQVTALGMALIPLRTHQDLDEWLATYRKLPAEKEYWLGLFNKYIEWGASVVPQIGNVAQIRAFEQAVIRVQETSLGYLWEDFLDEVYHQISRRHHFISGLCPDGNVHIIGVADPHFMTGSL